MKNDRTDIDVVVIGGGISGLVTAYELQRNNLNVRLLEAEARPGGVIGSREREGAIYEVGPNSTLDTTPLIDQLLGELGLRGERTNASAIASRRFIVRGGRPVALPTSPIAFLSTPAFSVGAKLRLFREPFVAPARAGVEESIASFVRRRLGREFLDYAIDPMVAGIYAGDPEAISVPAAFPRLHALEQKYGSLIKGQIRGARERKRNRETAKNTAGSFSFRRGMETLPASLGKAIRETTFGARVVALERSEAGFTVRYELRGASQAITAREVVLATPADVAARLISPFAPEAATSLAAIEYAPIAAIASLYRRENVRHALDGFGFLVPRVERRRILGTLFSSSMFEGRAPSGHVLLTTFTGGRRHPEIPGKTENDIAAIVSQELAQLLGATSPEWQEVTRWTRAIPQYTLGHLDRLRAVDEAERRIPALHFCANYRGGVSVGDCIKSAFAVAERIAARAGTPQGTTSAAVV